MELMICIILSVIVIGGIMAYNNAQKQKLVSSGEAVDRSDDFYRKKHVFKTNVEDIEKIGEAIDKATLNKHSISFEPAYDNGMIVFHNKIEFGSFGAALRSEGKDEASGKYLYRFQVEAWREKNGIRRQDLFGANILLTTIEKTIFSLDSETSVERTRGDFHAKASWI